MQDKTTESRLVFAQLATLGLALFGIYEFAPFVLDEGLLPGWEKGAEGVGKAFAQIPWVKVAAVGSMIPYCVMVSRIIPRKVIRRAHRSGFVEDTARENILGTAGIPQPE